MYNRIIQFNDFKISLCVRIVVSERQLLLW